MTDKKRALIICPGRGTYNREELGYLARHHSAQAALIESFDALRREGGQTPISELDGRSSFSPSEHTRGDNASPLIYASAYADFQKIDKKRFQPVAVTGNSMGWYISLAVTGVLTPIDAFKLINTMGSFMQEALLGGQIVYPIVDETWREIPGRKKDLLRLIAEIGEDSSQDLYLSIDLGGMMVFGGNETGLKALQGQLEPVEDRFPMRLLNHAAFHTPLQRPISERARASLPASLFQRPEIPLVDGRGKIWTKRGSAPHDLWDYTLGHQVVAPYDFTSAVQVAVKEFAPERIVILGPGTTLGGAVAQSLIAINWQGLSSKADFIARQKEEPLVLSMGMEAQRHEAVA
ncbi:MAG: hypothetical protein R3245_08820 [Kiloniellales bacterium]|nr:hypothetical protein [Kiloniellales bacterium]